MSTKIYDAYIVNKQMDAYELSRFCDELRKKVTYTCRKIPIFPIFQRIAWR